MDIQFPSDIQVRYRGGPRRVPVRRVRSEEGEEGANKV